MPEVFSASITEPPKSLKRTTSTKKRHAESLATSEDCLIFANSLVDISSATAEKIAKISSSDPSAIEATKQAKAIQNIALALRDRVSAKLSEGEEVSTIIEDINKTTTKILEEGKDMQDTVCAPLVSGINLSGYFVGSISLTVQV